MTRPFLACVFAVVLLSGCDGAEEPQAVPSFATEATGTPGGPPPSAGGESPAPASEAPRPAESSKPPESGGPRIVSFEVVVKPSCPSGGPEVHYDGNPVKLAWEVTGADEVEILINGGLYDRYPAAHTAEFPFTCDGEEGKIKRHEYTLRVAAGGQVVEDTIPATARIKIGS